MNKLLLLLLSLLMVTGAQAVITDIDDRGEYSVPQKLTFTRMGKDLDRSHRFEERAVAVEIFNVKRVYELNYRLAEVIVDERCIDRNYTYRSGRGNKKLRKMFANNMSRSERKRYVVKNVRGIGPSNVKHLIWYFEHSDTPRSWDDFKNIIKKAQKRAKKKAGNQSQRSKIKFYKEIVEKYRSSNKKNLGFKKSRRPTDCREWENIVEIELVKVLTSRDIKTLLRTERRYIRMSVVGVGLLNNEQETFHVTYDGENLAVTKETPYGSYRSKYTDNGNTIYLGLGGTRKKVAVKNTVQVSASMDQRTREVVLNIMDTGYDADAMADNALEVKLFWDRTWPASNEQLGNTLSYRIDNTSAKTIRTGIYIPKRVSGWFSSGKKKYFARYWLARSGSPYYSGGYSSDKDSQNFQN